ncbi:MAG: hypothetical protein M1834_008417 [Cirrosporium novae-zelandiae]|nr:MAG: hypothetical protein M1834_008417 [Cirrosporium novae-zelandiae]
MVALVNQSFSTIYNPLQSSYLGSTNQDPFFKPLFLAAENRTIWLKGGFSRFELQWRNPDEPNLRNLSCVAQMALYNMNISFENNVQTVTARKVSRRMLNSWGLYSNNDMISPNTTEPLYEYAIMGSSMSTLGVNISDYYQRANTVVLKDAVVLALAGLVGQKSTSTSPFPCPPGTHIVPTRAHHHPHKIATHHEPVLNTLIQESHLTLPPQSSQSQSNPLLNSNINITPTTLSSLLQNLKISLLTLNPPTTLTPTLIPILTTSYNLHYTFTNPPKLIFPYFTCLTATLLIMIAGFLAFLLDN